MKIVINLTTDDRKVIGLSVFNQNMIIMKICAVTMVRNDDFFLRRWVAYYGAELGMSNLYVYFDGKDQEIPEWCSGVHAVACDKIPGQVVEAEKIRLKFLSDRAAELLESYDLVIGTDADEFLVVDPDLHQSLAEFLGSRKIDITVSGLGVDVGQHKGCEKEIDGERPFLEQRKYGLLSTRYSKPSVIARPVTWGSGFHRIKGHNFHIVEGLFLFHFGYFDLKRIEARFNDKDRKAAGWTKHLARRARTIEVVSRKKALDWDRWTRFARIVQNLVRPPYAWNKPAMFNLDIVVRIPDRFSKII